MTEAGAALADQVLRSPGPDLGVAALEPHVPVRVDDRLHGIRDLRRHLARGMLTNGAFQLGAVGLTAVRGFIVAAFMTRSDYGMWGLIGLTIWTAMALKTQFGAGEKYIQQSEANQEHAFQRALTMELIFASVAAPVGAAVVFAVVAVTGNWNVLAPGLVLLLLLPAAVLQFPIATFYRRLDFRRQRILQSVEPVVAALVMVALAVAGAGYWSFVIAMLCGSWTLALIVVRVSPYRFALRYERGTLREYLGFSLPLLVTAISVLAMFYVIYLVGNTALGVAGIGVFTLAGNLLQFTDQADSIITETLYPAVCAMKDRVSLLSELFVKSNRLSLIWAVPFGVGMTLFASDLVRFVIGPRWLGAVPLLQIMGLATAVHHVGYNWGAFVKASGRTWPIALASVPMTAVVIGAGIPLMYSDHIVGLGIAFALAEVVGFAIRGLWLARFFDGFRIGIQLLRAFAPTAVAVAPVLLFRALAGPEQSLAASVAVLAVYVGLTAAATLRFERPLLREAFGYMLRSRPQVA